MTIGGEASEPRIKSSLSRLKQRNVAKIMHALYTHRQLTLAEVSSLVGLKRATVAVLLGELVAGKVAQENGVSQDTGGRHARTFGLATAAFRAVGVNLYRGGVQVAVTDLMGNILKFSEYPVAPSDLDLDALKETIATMVAMDPEPVVGIGVGVPGPIDLRTGMVLNPPNFVSMHGVELRTTMANWFGLPVVLDDDARTRAVAEWMLGSGRGHHDLVYVSVGAGIGSGIIIHDQIYYGVHGLAGQVGHVTVDPEGARCSCGNVGCLEVVVVPLLRCPTPDHRRIAELLSQAIIAVGLFIDPELVIIGGDAPRLELVVSIVAEEVSRYAPFAKMDVRAGVLGKNTAVLGAAMIAVGQFLNDPKVAMS